MGPQFRIIAFEYGSVALWVNRTLQGVVGELDSWGFTCYLQWDRVLLPLTGECWNPAYECHAWINVVCANRRDAEWSGELARMVPAAF